VRSILDAGCGVGFWRAAARELWPRARYHGLEISDYLCRRYGWTCASIVDYKPGRQFDLIVCQSVLQYLSDHDARARDRGPCRRLLAGPCISRFPPRRTGATSANRRRTDATVRLRSAQW
jgi:SAM-dependent methyltransferase